MITKISHVGVVVSDLDESLKFYERVFGLKSALVKDAMNGRLKVAFIPIGDDEIELLYPLDSNTSFGKFLKTRGPGIHHISLATDDIESEVKRMKMNGIAFTEEKPKVGAHGVKIIFTIAETTGGVTVELCQES